MHNVYITPQGLSSPTIWAAITQTRVCDRSSEDYQLMATLFMDA